jgi:hypothetical protein
MGNHYYRPDDFPFLSADVRKELNAKRCLIPQDVEKETMTNVVNGEFAHHGQKDWAVYCSVDGKSKVLIIWGGPSQCTGEPFGNEQPIADDLVYKYADAQQLGRVPPRGSFWNLSVVPRKQVVARQRIGIQEGKLLKSADHDALQRISIGGTNGVYCVNGKWRELWYAD